jgi:multiple sugar transport system permease protein
VRRPGQAVLSIGGTAAFLVFTLFPFYWMIVVSLKPDRDLYDLAQNPFWLQGITADHFVSLFTTTSFPRWMLNSVIVSVSSTAFSILLSILAGYSLARLRYRGAGAIGWGIFITYLIPPTLLFLPLTAVMATFGLLNSLWGLVLSYPTFLIPFCTWLLMGYFKGIPKELEESALVDGCTRLQAMYRIVLPLALPGILSAGIFAFTLSWNEYIYALVFISDSGLKTIPIGVPSELIRGDAFFWGELMAGALLGSVPVALLYSFFVDHFVSGLTAGAVKG